MMSSCFSCRGISCSQSPSVMFQWPKQTAVQQSGVAQGSLLNRIGFQTRSHRRLEFIIIFVTINHTCTKFQNWHSTSPYIMILTMHQKPWNDHLISRFNFPSFYPVTTLLCLWGCPQPCPQNLHVVLPNHPTRLQIRDIKEAIQELGPRWSFDVVDGYI